MLKFEKFTGINNVLEPHRLKTGDLTIATDVDIGLSGEITRRAGYTETSALCHKNVWQGAGFVLATCNGDLVKTAGGMQTLLLASIGNDRIWYLNLPDGRTAFSNGLISGTTDGVSVTGWGVPVPPSIGNLTDVAGSLDPGDYQYQLTYVRLSDGVEGPPEYSNPLPVALGGIVLMALPALAGYKINVYITGANAGTGYLAGSTVNGVFSFTGKNNQLILPCRTEFLIPMPPGRTLAMWRGRALSASGKVLYASRAGQWELCDVRRDFKQFEGDITLVQPVDGGIFVGTTKELGFLAGDEFDKLVYRSVVSGPTVLGSGVSVRGELIQQREGAGQGAGMICIADSVVVAGFSDGQVVRLTEGRYETTATEVAATFRMLDRVPQYIAIPQ